MKHDARVYSFMRTSITTTAAIGCLFPLLLLGFILVSVCFAEPAYEIRGTLSRETYFAGKPLCRVNRKFTIMVNAPTWFARTTPADSTFFDTNVEQRWMAMATEAAARMPPALAGLPLAYEVGCDGTNIYNLIVVGDFVASAGAAVHPEVIPAADDFSIITPLWLAYVFADALNQTNHARLTPVWSVNETEGWCVRNNAFVSKCEVSTNAPHLPLRVQWFFPAELPASSVHSQATPLKARQIQHAPQINQLVAEYVVLAITNLAGLSVPSAFTIKLYQYPRDTDQLSELPVNSVWHGNISSLHLAVPQADYRPRLDKLSCAVVNDFRFKKFSPPVVVSYTSSNRTWRPIDDPVLKQKFLLQVQAVQGTAERRTLPTAALGALLLLPLLRWFRNVRRQRLKLHQQAQNT